MSRSQRCTALNLTLDVECKNLTRGRIELIRLFLVRSAGHWGISHDLIACWSPPQILAHVNVGITKGSSHNKILHVRSTTGGGKYAAQQGWGCIVSQSFREALIKPEHAKPEGNNHVLRFHAFGPPPSSRSNPRNSAAPFLFRSRVNVA